MDKRLFTGMALIFGLYITWFFIGSRLGFIKEVPVEEGFLEDMASDSPSDTPNLEAVETTPTPIENSVQLEQEEKPIEPKTVVLENQLLRITLDNKGGIITNATLLTYFDSAKSINHVRLINSTRFFPGHVIFEDNTSNTNWMYEVSEQSAQEVVFTARKPGIMIEKRFSLIGDYSLACTVRVQDEKNRPFFLITGEGLQAVTSRDQVKPSFLSFGSVNQKTTKISWSKDGDHKEKAIKKLDVTAFKPVYESGDEEPVVWFGLQDNYFASVFLPKESLSNFFIRGTEQFFEDVRYQTPVLALKANDGIEGQFYFGPIDGSNLNEADPKLNNILSYGYAGLLSKWLFGLLKLCHSWTGNWGWAIILLTLAIKLALFPLMMPSIRSSQKMKDLQPKLERIRKKFPGKDLESKQKLSQETMQLYKEEGVNPFSSCITMLPQMPVFFAYFSLLQSSISLRQADWLFWADLSMRDTTFILPVLMAVTMYLTQLMTPMPSADPAQAKMMKFMPVIFSVMFIGMPSGLVLYMITTNLFTMIQTAIVKIKYGKR